MKRDKIIFSILLLLLIPNIVWAKTGDTFDFDISYYKLMSGDKAPADQDTKNRAEKLENIIRYWADAIYEATNGQNFLGKVRIYQNGDNFLLSHIQWIAERKIIEANHGEGKGWYAPLISLGGAMARRDQIYMEDRTFFRIGGIENRPDFNQVEGGYILAHESGHYIYNLYDEYSTGWFSSSLGMPTLMEDIRDNSSFPGENRNKRYAMIGLK